LDFAIAQAAVEVVRVTDFSIGQVPIVLASGPVSLLAPNEVAVVQVQLVGFVIGLAQAHEIRCGNELALESVAAAHGSAPVNVLAATLRPPC